MTLFKHMDMRTFMNLLRCNKRLYSYTTNPKYNAFWKANLSKLDCDFKWILEDYPLTITWELFNNVKKVNDIKDETSECILTYFRL